MMALCDGERLALLPSSEDHKAVRDGDQGPNTGGMGTYSPSPLVDAALGAHIVETLFVPDGAGAGRRRPAVPRPALRRPHADARPRARWSSSGTAASAIRRRSRCSCALDEDLLPWLAGAAARRAAARARRACGRGVAVCVVLAAARYPGTPRLGDAITGLPSRTPTTCGCFTPARGATARPAGHRRRARPGRHGASAPIWRPRAPAPTAPSTRFVSTGCTFAETSACEDNT